MSGPETEHRNMPVLSDRGGKTAPSPDRAETLLRTGRERLRDWRISRGNAYRAQLAFDQAIPLLTGDPRRMQTAREGRDEARKMMEEEFKAHRFSAERAIRAGDGRLAEAELSAILEAIPDGEDPRARYARERLRALGGRTGGQ